MMGSLFIVVFTVHCARTHLCFFLAIFSQL